jgi:RNA recognition motif-containing protein
MSPNVQPAPRQIFIGNLSYEATEEDLTAAIKNIGVQVFRVRVVSDKESGRPRGFAFVDVDRNDPKPIEVIIDLINRGVEICGRTIRADHATSRPRAAPEKSPLKPQGGRGKAPSEFRRGRNEFEDE